MRGNRNTRRGRPRKTSAPSPASLVSRETRRGIERQAEELARRELGSTMTAVERGENLSRPEFLGGRSNGEGFG